MSVKNSPRTIIDRSESSKVSEVVHYETGPDSITWHKIWDHEIEKIVNISRPVSLSLSTTAAGAFLGLIPTAMEAFKAARDGSGFGLDDAIILLIWAATFTLGTTVGWFAYLGHKDANAVVSAIRERARRQL